MTILQTAARLLANRPPMPAWYIHQAPSGKLFWILADTLTSDEDANWLHGTLYSPKEDGGWLTSTCWTTQESCVRWHAGMSQQDIENAFSL